MTNEYLFDVGNFPKESNDSDIFLAYGDVYKGIIEHLLNNFEEIEENCHDYVIIPILFLFRHYIELKLKGLLLFKKQKINVKSHNIYEPLQKIKGIQIHLRISSKTENFIKQLNEIDPRGDAFRYSINKKMKRIFDNTKNKEFFNNINKFSTLKDSIEQVMKDLENIEGDFDDEKESIQEGYRNSN